MSCSNVWHGFIYLWLGTTDELLYIFLISRVITTFSKVPAPSKIVTEVRHSFFRFIWKLKFLNVLILHLCFTFLSHA